MGHGSDHDREPAAVTQEKAEVLAAQRLGFSISRSTADMIMPAVQ
jgi:hypothetical protein